MVWWKRTARLLALATAVAVTTGCASFYVDGNAPEVPASQLRKPATAPAVQLIWEFQTKGVANARATEALKSRVVEQVGASGLFSQVSDTPVASGALLSISVNNIPLNDDAASRGFVAGLTFGLAGQTVGDGYDSALRYTSGRPGAPTIERSGKHVIYTSLGSAAPPPGALKMSSVDEAVFTMLRQLLSRSLNELATAPNFP